MKKLHVVLRETLVLCLYLLSVSSASAQIINNYTFSQETGGSYIPLTDSTVLASGPSLDNETYPLVLPFPFNFDNTIYNNIRVGVNGYISFGTSNPGAGYWMIQSTSTGTRFISIFDTNLASSTTNNTELSYKVAGIAPNRILMIQWKNFSLYNSTILNANFQLHLHEGSSLIEMTYGNCNMTGWGDNVSLQIGLRGLNNTVFMNREGYSGDWDNTMPGDNQYDDLVYQSGNNPPAGIKFKFTPPAACVTPTAQPTNLILSEGVNNVNISYTPGNPSTDKYLILRTPGIAIPSVLPTDGTNYTVGSALGNSTVVYSGSTSNYNNTGLTQLTTYTYTIIPFNDGICMGGPVPLYNTYSPLSGSVTTAGPRTYTWIPNSGSANWTQSTNWMPQRNVPLPGDTLLFNNNGTVTATNVPTQTVNTLIISNSSNVILNTVNASTLTLNKLLQVDTGSAIHLNGQSFKLAFASGGPDKPANIYGNMAIGGSSTFAAANSIVAINDTLLLTDSGSYIAMNGQTTINSNLFMNGSSSYKASSGITELNAVVNLYDDVFFNTSVGTSGNTTLINVNSTINNYGPASTFSTLNVNSSNNTYFNAGSIYNHMRNGGSIPPATYAPSSIINITGITNTAPIFSSTSNNVGNLIWNCPNQSAAIITNGGLVAIQEDLFILNTGTYSLRLSGYLDVYGEFRQMNSTLKLFSFGATLTTHGTANLISGVLDVSSTGYNVPLYIKGDLNQHTGHMITNSSSVITETFFNGTQTQHITLEGTFGPGKISYTLDNQSGAVLEGTIPIRQNASNNILNGSWTGSGGFTYESGTILNYNTAGNRYCTVQEWPANNGPEAIEIMITSSYPFNMIYMPSGDRSINALTLKGILVLENNNLTLNGNASSLTMTLPFTGSLIATNGTGQFIRNITTNGSYLYPVGDITGNPEYSPFELTIATNTIARKIGVLVTDAKHPADLSNNDYLSRFWSFSDDGGTAPIGYKGSFTFPASDMTGNQIRLNRWNGTIWNSVSSEIAYANGNAKLTIDDTLQVSSQHPLNNNDFTGRKLVNNIYTWTGTLNKEYIEPQNWSPERVYTSANDILQFNSGNSDTVKNIPSDIISRLIITNNTTAILQAGPGAPFSPNNPELVINSDQDTFTDELNVSQGSTLLLNGTIRGLTLKLAGDSSTGIIDGNLEMVSGGGNRQQVNIAGNGSVLTINGKITNGGSSSNMNFQGIDSNSYLIYGNYEHKYTINGGSIPNARWMDGSVCTVSSYTTNTSSTGMNGPSVSGGIFPNFYKLIYDCPNQTSLIEWIIPKMTVRDSFIVNHTGTGRLNFKNNYQFTLQHFTQRNGIVELSKNAFNENGGNIDIEGSWIQEDGLLYSPTNYATNKPILNFNGTGVQLASFHDIAPTGPIMYKISNPQGIELNGTGNLNNYFEIDTNSAICIAVPINTPIQTALKLKYLENASLIFKGNGNVSPDTIIFPSAYGPYNLMVDIGSANTIHMRGSRILPNELAMISGDIDLDTATLTIGVSVDKPGKLTYTHGISGDINITTGSLIRWYGLSSLPTAPDVGLVSSTNKGFYPLGNGNSKRHVALYFSTVTALMNGGTIKVSHNSLPGYTTGLSVIDGSYTINSRSNASWSFETGNGLAISNGSFGIRLTGADLFSVNAPADLRILQGSTAIGNHIAGSGVAAEYMAQRSTITLNDLDSNPFYIGSAADNIGSAFISVADGDWNIASTWDHNAVPGANAIVYISANDTVTINSTAIAKAIYINKNSNLMVPGGNLNVDSTIINDGTLTINGSIVTLGPVGGGKSNFTNTGTLNMISGTLNINGNLELNRGDDYGTSIYPGTLNQSGGNVNIDGNAGGIANNSVASGTPILRIATPNINATGGSITIVDPHASNAPGLGSITAYFSESLPYNIAAGHTFIFGDGVSTDSGGTTNGFYIIGNSHFGQLVINGSPSGNSRIVTQTNTSTITGDLVLNNNGVFRLGYTRLYGNILVNANATLNAYYSNLEFLNDTTSILPQTVGGQGIFGAMPLGGSHFKDITINNPKGVIFDIGNVIFNGELNFGKGVLTLTNGSNIRGGINSSISNTSQNNGWINAKLIRKVGNSNVLFPIGDQNTYSPLTISGHSVGTWDTVIAYTVAGDHPNVASSTINPQKSVNRYYVIDPLSATTSNTEFNVTFGFQQSDVDPSSTWAHFGGARYHNNAWTPLTIAALTPDSVQLVTNNIGGYYQVGEISSPPNIIQQPQSVATCTGTSAYFSVMAQQATAYAWQFDDGSGWSGLANDTIYSGVFTSQLQIASAVAAMNNLQFRCAIINNIDTIYSSGATLTVGASVTPSIMVSTTQNDTICSGIPASFSAIAVNGGATPAYQWKLNGINVGTNSTTLNLPSLNNGDVINCELTSSSGCAIPEMATSNSLTFTVFPQINPSVVISTTEGAVTCQGASVTFEAVVTNGSDSMAYQWRRNGINVGVNNNIFTTNNLNDNDTITCVVTVGNYCISTQEITSNPLNMNVIPPITPSVTISSSLATTICTGTMVSFSATAVNSGNNPIYQWKKNGSNVGINSIVYTDGSLENGDVITCDLIITSSAGDCYTTNNAISNSIAMIVNTSVTPSVSITANPESNICQGQSVVFNAIVINGSIDPVYHWKKNSTNVGTSTSTYTDSGLMDDDTITCTVTYVGNCYLPSESNPIIMTVNQLIAPELTINTPETTICSGTPASFTAIAANSGFSVSYQWKKNGIGVGINSDTYTDAALNSGDIISCVLTSNATCITQPTVSSNNITMTVNPVVIPTVSIITPQTIICSGDTVTFTATSMNEGVTPSYQWQVNGDPAGTNAPDFTTPSLDDGDVISCTMSSNATCVSLPTAESNSITMTINTLATPTITIMPTDSTICQGETLNFTATVTNEGATPSYQWKINNIPSGTNSNSFTTTTLNNGDIVTCTLISSEACLSTPEINSNSLAITVNPVITPAITISSSENDTICPNTTVVYSASISGGGDNPVYQWKKNNTNVGTNIPSYVDNMITNGDMISCVLISDIVCATVTEVASDTLTMTVLPIVVPSVVITASPGTEVSAGTNVTFTASITNGGDAPTFQWKKNAIPVGTNATTYSSGSLNNGDVITVTVTSNAACADPGEVTSNTLTMAINTVGINKIDTVIQQVNIFPNPTKHKVYVKVLFGNADVRAAHLELQTVAGQTVIDSYPVKVNKCLLEHELVLPQNLANGTYLIRISGEGFSSVRKIIVEK